MTRVYNISDANNVYSEDGLQPLKITACETARREIEKEKETQLLISSVRAETFKKVILNNLSSEYKSLKYTLNGFIGVVLILISVSVQLSINLQFLHTTNPMGCVYLSCMVYFSWKPNDLDVRSGLSTPGTIVWIHFPTMCDTNHIPDYLASVSCWMEN